MLRPSFATRRPLCLPALLAAMHAATGAPACSAGGSPAPFASQGSAGGSEPAGAGGSGAASSSSSTASGGAGTGSGGGDLLDAGLADAAPGEAPPIYAHDWGHLYRGDPTVSPLELEHVGAFDCIGGPGESSSMTDLAVTADGRLFGISTKNFYELEIEGGVVKCKSVVPLNNPKDIQFYGLAIAPKGVLDPDHEVLVAGNTAGELWSIDENGNLTQRGALGVVPPDDGNGHVYENAGQIWELSGDILFIENDGDPLGFATVRDCPKPPSPGGCNLVDTLIELDVAKLKTATSEPVIKAVRGLMVTRPGCADGVNGSYGSVYGIAAWGDKVFGFTRLPGNNGGYSVDISNADGTACLIEAFDTLAWYGAGITTRAKVKPPPPK